MSTRPKQKSKLKRLFPDYIAAFAVAADQEIVLGAARGRAADRMRAAPRQLGIMADIVEVAADAVVREDARLEIGLFREPQADHLLRAIIAAGAGPQILALRVAIVGIIRGMFELAELGDLQRIDRGVVGELLVP